MHTIILEQLPLTPEYRSIDNVVDMFGSGIGDGPGQFKSAGSMGQVCFGPDGTVWVVDFIDHLVHHFKQSGELIKTIGTGTAGNAWLNEPNGMAVSRLGSSIFIAECGMHRISEFNQTDGAFVRVLDTLGLEYPRSMCLSPDETTLAVACAISHCIKVIRVDGSKAPRTIGGEKGSGDGQFDCPSDVRFTPDGQQLVVADSWNSRVQVLGLDGSFVREMPLGARVRAVAVDAVGNIIAATSKHVKVFSPEGTLRHDRLGGLEMGGAALGGLAIDPASGRIAVGDREVGMVHLL
jgi:DNA-binding beta-propeller fold protein YncE